MRKIPKNNNNARIKLAEAILSILGDCWENFVCSSKNVPEEQIHWVPLSIDGFRSKALLVLLRDETIPLAIRGVQLFGVLSDHICSTDYRKKRDCS